MILTFCTYTSFDDSLHRNGSLGKRVLASMFGGLGKGTFLRKTMGISLVWRVIMLSGFPWGVWWFSACSVSHLSCLGRRLLVPVDLHEAPVALSSMLLYDTFL